MQPVLQLLHHPLCQRQGEKPEAGGCGLRVKGLVAQGYKEVVLTGIHLSSYGIEHMEDGPVKGGDWDHTVPLGPDTDSPDGGTGAHPPGFPGAENHHCGICRKSWPAS